MHDNLQYKPRKELVLLCRQFHINTADLKNEQLVTLLRIKLHHDIEEGARVSGLLGRSAYSSLLNVDGKPGSMPDKSGETETVETSLVEVVNADVSSMVLLHGDGDSGGPVSSEEGAASRWLDEMPTASEDSETPSIPLSEAGDGSSLLENLKPISVVNNVGVPSGSEEGAASRSPDEIPTASEDSEPPSIFLSGADGTSTLVRDDTATYVFNAEEGGASRSPGEIQAASADSERHSIALSEGDDDSSLVEVDKLTNPAPAMSEVYPPGSSVVDVGTNLGQTGTGGRRAAPQSAESSSSDQHDTKEGLQNDTEGLGSAACGADQPFEEQKCIEEAELNVVSPAGDIEADSEVLWPVGADGSSPEAGADVHSQVEPADKPNMLIDSVVATSQDVAEKQDSSALLSLPRALATTESETDDGDGYTIGHDGNTISTLELEDSELASADGETQVPQPAEVPGQGDDAKGFVSIGSSVRTDLDGDSSDFLTSVGLRPDEEVPDRDQDGNGETLLRESEQLLQKSDDICASGRGDSEEVLSRGDAGSPKLVVQEVVDTYLELNGADSSISSQRALGSAEVTTDPVELYQDDFTGANNITVGTNPESPTDRADSFISSVKPLGEVPNQDGATEGIVETDADSPTATDEPSPERFEVSAQVNRGFASSPVTEEGQPNAPPEDFESSKQPCSAVDGLTEASTVDDSYTERQDAPSGSNLVLSAPSADSSATPGNTALGDLPAKQCHVGAAEDSTTLTEDEGGSRWDSADQFAGNSHWEQGTIPEDSLDASPVISPNSKEELPRQLSAFHEVPVECNVPAEKAALTGVGCPSHTVGGILSSNVPMVTVTSVEGNEAIPVGNFPASEAVSGDDNVVGSLGSADQGTTEAADDAQCGGGVAAIERPVTGPASGDEEEVATGGLETTNVTNNYSERMEEPSPSVTPASDPVSTTKDDTTAEAPLSSGEANREFGVVDEAAADGAQTIGKEPEGRPSSQDVPTSVETNRADTELGILSSSDEPAGIIDVEKELGDLDEYDPHPANRFEDDEVNVVESIPAVVKEATTEGLSVGKDKSGPAAAGDDVITVPESTKSSGQSLLGYEDRGSSKTAGWLSSFIMWFTQLCSSTH